MLEGSVCADLVVAHLFDLPEGFRPDPETGGKLPIKQ